MTKTIDIPDNPKLKNGMNLSDVMKMSERFFKERTNKNIHLSLEVCLLIGFEDESIKIRSAETLNYLRSNISV